MLIAVLSRFRGTTACITIALALSLPGRSAHGQPSAQPEPGEATFTVFLHSTPIGVERVVVARSPEGWTVRSNGRLSPPLSLENRLSEVDYDQVWTPQRLTMEGSRLGQEFAVQTSFDGSSATNAVRDGDSQSEARDQVDPVSVVLPDYFFGAYEALAVRLDGGRSGDLIPIYVPPRGQTEALIREVIEQSVETAQRSFVARVFRITFQNPNQPLDADVWVDSSHRLLRVTIPTAGLDIAREDLTSVSTRLAGVVVPGDAQERVPASGFSLAATVTTPVGHETPRNGWPAVILVPGTRSADRDEYQLGVPIHGRLAGVLAEAGYLVVRYDRRGIGQSGGRPESATVDDYAEDVREAVRYLEDSDDVDRDRVVVLAHGEGGWIGLRAASRENKIKALVLVATPATTGSALVLEQQQAELDRLQTPEVERRERIALQQSIHAAILEGGTWDDIPEDLQRRADTPWFRSFLEFDPAEVMRRTRQPLLIIHGLLDQQIAPSHADRLAELAEMRDRRESTVELAKLANVNHVMVAAEAGAMAEYANLSDPDLDVSVTATLVDWLERTVPASE